MNGRSCDLIGLDSWDLAPTGRQNVYRKAIAERSNANMGKSAGHGHHWVGASFDNGSTGYSFIGGVGQTGAQAAYWSATHYMACNGMHNKSIGYEGNGSWMIVPRLTNSTSNNGLAGNPVIARPSWATAGATGELSIATPSWAPAQTWVQGACGDVGNKDYQPDGIHGIAGQNTSGGKSIFRPQNIYQARCPRVGIEIYKTFESSEDASGDGYGSNPGSGAG